MSVQFDWGGVGGKEVSILEAKERYGANITQPYIDFGAMPRFSWGEPMEKAAHEAVSNLRKFAIQGKSADDTDRADLFAFWRAEEVKAALGFEYPGIHQLTGSCVGAGFGNVAFTTSIIEVLRLKQPELITIPFWLFTYGRGRFRGGMRSPGEGSSGSVMAEAALKDGIVEATRAGLPQFKNSDGLVWGSNIEISWSDGDAKQSLDLLPFAQKHLFKSVAKLKSADEVRQAIINGYSVTEASMYGFSPRVEGEGADALLLGRRGPRWAHQMSIQSYRKHPKFGPVYWCHNQWGLNAHGKDPWGGPAGGVWILEQDVDWFIRDGDECFAYSQFDGFPAQDIFSWGY